MASTYLSRTCGTASDSTRFVFSTWVKFNNQGDYPLVSGGNSSTNRAYLAIAGNGSLNYREIHSGTTYTWTTNAKLKDVSAWYHIYLQLDSNQSTASDRVKIYINNELQTYSSSSTFPSTSGSRMFYNGTNWHRVGGWYDGSSNAYLNGLLAHTHFVDTTSSNGYDTYTPSTFGETDSTSGIWKPKISPSITYGNEGYFLKYQDSSSLGDDSSGNTNDFTLSGSGTQTLDTPSNVFATLNPLQSNNAKDAVTATSNGNLTFNDTNNADWRTMIGTFGVNSGKWYWEVKATSLSGSGMIGVGRQDYVSITLNKASNAYTGSDSGDYSFSYRENGTYYYNGTSSGSHTTFTAGNIIMIALDMDNGAIYTGVNGTWNDSGDPTSGASKTGASYTGIQTGEFYSSSVSASAGNAQLSHNFGNGYFGTTAVSSAQNDGAGYGKFEYSPPTGYYALCTKNINTYG